jgi:small subunit ribosomal protein S7
MSRRRAAVKREIQPDPKFGDVVVSKFMNSLMTAGRKSVAENILYGAFDLIESRSGGDPLKIFHEAIENVKPMTEVRSRRVGGATYQIPIEVRIGRRQALAIRWIIAVCRKRGENTMVERFAGELMDAADRKSVV